MILQAGLTKKQWGEAAKIACYLMNMCPSSILSFKTPQEVWTGKPPSYQYLIVFRCEALDKTNCNLELRSVSS